MNELSFGVEGHNMHCSPTWTAQLNLLPFPKLRGPEVLTAQTYGFSQHTANLTAQLNLLPFPKLHSPEILTAQTYGFSQHTADLTAQLNLMPFPKLHSPEILTAQTYGFSQHTLDLTAQLLTVQLKLKVKPNVCVCGGGLTQRYVSRMMFGVRWRRSNIKIHVDEMCFVFCHHVRTSSAAVLAFCVLGVQVVILGRRAVRPWSRLFVSFQP